MSFPSEVPEKWMCTHVRAAGWGRWWSSLDEIRGTFLKRETDFARFQNETQYTCFPYLFVQYEKFYLFIHVFCTINIEFFFFFCTNICTNIFLQFFFFFVYRTVTGKKSVSLTILTSIHALHNGENNCRIRIF